MAGSNSDQSPSKWVWRGGAIAVLLLGWFFVLLQNNFHITPPVFFVCMGYFAGVSAMYALFQTGATAVAGKDDEDPSAAWGRPLGPIGELDREKRSLLKAIKEAEFDHQMGKLSKVDADTMINTYRSRAIEVIKELERRDAIHTGVRGEIEREVRARLLVDQKADAKKAQGKQKAERRKKPGEAAKEAARAAAAAAEAATRAAAAAAAAASPSSSAMDDEAADDAADAAAAAAHHAAAEADKAAQAAREAADDADDETSDESNADTASEPARETSAKRESEAST